MDIKTVAKMAGVSKTTISRYLNGGYVSSEKKEIIKKVIEETGYKPMREAIMLRTKKSKQIGVILPKINSNSISQMVSGISKILKENGYYLLLADTYNDENEELNYLNIFKENNVDGIILVSTIISSEHEKLIKSLSVPLVILAQSHGEFPCVYFDDVAAARMATIEVLKGHTNPAIIKARADDIAVGAKRLQGFKEAIEESGIIFKPENEYLASFSFNGGYMGMKELLDNDPTIDSVFVATETMTSGALNYLHEINKEIPKDISIATVGSGMISQASFPTITCSEFYYYDSGTKAAAMVLDMISNKNACKALKIDFEVKIRNSTNS